MRLTCSVDVVNRLLPEHNLKKKLKGQHAQLSIGHKPGSGAKPDKTVFLMMCTSKDRNGVKYPIKGNIEQIFGRFLNEGKCTIRFKEPKEDLCLSKADSLQLKNFLTVLRMVAQGKETSEVTLSTLAPASTKNVEKPKTRMSVLTKREYPITTNFPGTLEYLRVNGCGMKRFDSRLLRLKRLQCLDLNDNLLPELPEDICLMENLRDLSVSNNQLTKLPMGLFKQSLQNHLTTLNLSNNQLKAVPLQICELTALMIFHVDYNALETLPPTIGRLENLKVFTAAENKLQFLPASFIKLHFDKLSLDGNPFISENTDVTHATIPVPSLIECSARSIKKLRVPYAEEDLFPHLFHYLNSARQCWCGQYCFQCSVRFLTQIDLRQTATEVSATSAPIESFLCSVQCLNRFRQNSKAYWRR